MKPFVIKRTSFSFYLATKFGDLDREYRIKAIQSICDYLPYVMKGLLKFLLIFVSASAAGAAIISCPLAYIAAMISTGHFITLRDEGPGCLPDLCVGVSFVVYMAITGLTMWYQIDTRLIPYIKQKFPKRPPKPMVAETSKIVIYEPPQPWFITVALRSFFQKICIPVQVEAVNNETE